MSEEEWIKERAIDLEATDVTPQLEDNSLSPVLSQDKGKSKK